MAGFDPSTEEKLKITLGPTWMANNKHLFDAIHATAIQNSFCKHNPSLAGCKNDLSDSKDDQCEEVTAPKR